MTKWQTNGRIHHSIIPKSFGFGLKNYERKLVSRPPKSQLSNWGQGTEYGFLRPFILAHHHPNYSVMLIHNGYTTINAGYLWQYVYFIKTKLCDRRQKYFLNSVSKLNSSRFSSLSSVSFYVYILHVWYVLFILQFIRDIQRSVLLNMIFLLLS